MSEKPIKQLVLYFPHGTTVENCDFIARRVERIVEASVSEGGFMVTSKYGLNVDNVTFSEDTMMYQYGYDKSEKTNE
jgi:hypothetical protein